jgi:hypothetical protein
MNNIIAFVKRLRLARILVVCLAGIVLLVSTACSQSPSVSSSKLGAESAKGKPPYELKTPQATHMEESYTTEPRRGGMNEHRDVDRRRDTSPVESRADELVNQSQRNLQKRAATPVEAADNLRRERGSAAQTAENKLEKASERVGSSVEEMKEGAERGFRNLKENVKSAAEDVSENVQQTVR